MQCCHCDIDSTRSVPAVKWKSTVVADFARRVESLCLSGVDQRVVAHAGLFSLIAAGAAVFQFVAARPTDIMLHFGRQFGYFPLGLPMLFCA